MKNKIIFFCIVIAFSYNCGIAEIQNKSNRYFTFLSEPYSYIDVDTIPRFCHNGQGVIEYINNRLQIIDSIKSHQKAIVMVIIKKQEKLKI